MTVRVQDGRVATKQWIDAPEDLVHIKRTATVEESLSGSFFSGSKPLCYVRVCGLLGCDIFTPVESIV